MIANGDYYMTRDEDGTRCVWATDKTVCYIDGMWCVSTDFTTEPIWDEDFFRDEEWADLLGRKCFGIRKGGSGWITVSEDPA